MTDVISHQATDEPAETVTSRRQLLRMGGVGVAAAAAATAAGVIANATPAGAIGATVTVDGSFIGTGTTQLTDSQLKAVIDDGSRVAILGQNLTSAGGGPGNGVQGDGIVGVVGNTNATSGGVGVQGNGAHGTGVLGIGTATASYSAVGVHGQGVGGGFSTGALIENTSGGTALRVRSSSGPVAFLEQTTPPGSIPPSTGSWAAGTILLKNGHAYYCYKSGAGTASKWARLSGAYIPLNPPKRAYTSTAGGGKLAVSDSRVVSLVPSGFPAGARSALLNVSVMDTNGEGNLSVYRHGSANPGTPNVHWWGANQSISNSVTSLVSNNGKVRVRCGGHAGARTHFVIDVVGYYP